jgi:hypothetical protein
MDELENATQRLVERFLCWAGFHEWVDVGEGDLQCSRCGEYDTFDDWIDRQW